MRRVAVLLNRNAQRASSRLLSRIARAVPADDLFVSATLEEARGAIERIAARGYEAVCVGGGDGTFAQAASELLAITPERLPVLLPLRLGGGNAIHDVCGSSAPTEAGLRVDLRRAASDEPATPLRLLTVNGALAHFTGTGIDARHIEDFHWLIKDRLGRGPLAPLFRGVPAIVSTVLLRTLPRLALESPVRLRIVNTGAPARALSPSGTPAGPALAAGDVLYQGPVTIAAAATITQYSRGMTFFPFADHLDGRFQLRVANAGAMHAVVNLRRIFAGTYHNPDKLWDFAVDSVRFEFATPTVFHAGGDLHGRADGFEVALAPRAIPILRAIPRPAR